MACFLIVGLPGHGKSLLLAYRMVRLLRRNRRWYNRSKKLYGEGIKRVIYTDQILKKFWQPFIEGGWIVNYKHWNEWPELSDCDLICEEVAKVLPARKSDSLPYSLQLFLENQDRRGIDFYAATQMPMQVDIYFRRLCERVEVVRKIFGSRRPSKTKPPVKFVWGLIWIGVLKRNSYSKNEDEWEFEVDWLRSLTNWFIIRKWKCNLYETQQVHGKLELPKFKHYERTCEDPNCLDSKGRPYKHVIHE